MIPESVLPTVPVNNALSKKAAEQSTAFSFTETILPGATACFRIHTYTRLRGVETDEREENDKKAE